MAASKDAAKTVAKAKPASAAKGKLSIPTAGDWPRLAEEALAYSGTLPPK